MSKSCCTGQGHLIIKISQNIGHVHILRLIVYIKDDNESNSCELVDALLTDFMLLLKGDEISRSCGTGQVVVVVNHCFTSLFGTKGLLSDIIIR